MDSFITDMVPPSACSLSMRLQPALVKHPRKSHIQRVLLVDELAALTGNLLPLGFILWLEYLVHAVSELGLHFGIVHLTVNAAREYRIVQVRTMNRRHLWSEGEGAHRHRLKRMHDMGKRERRQVKEYLSSAHILRHNLRYLADVRSVGVLVVTAAYLDGRMVVLAELFEPLGAETVDGAEEESVV